METFFSTFVATLYNEMLSLQLVELIAALLALAYVLLAAKQKIACWLCAFASSSLYVVIFWQAQLPYQAALNVFYVAMAIYGWLTWQRIDNNGEPMKVRELGALKHLFVVTGLSFICWGLLALQPQAELSVTHYLDTGTAVFSVFTTWLVVQKYLANWIYWIVINTAAVWLYASQSLYFTSVLFCLYVLMSVYGLISWRAALRDNTDTSIM